VRTIFQSHALNAEGRNRCNAIGDAFDDLLTLIERETGISADTRGEGSRELAVCRTDLEKALHFARKAVAMQTRFQDRGSS